MNKEDLGKISDKLISTLLDKNFDDVDEVCKVEVSLILMHFFEDYENNIRVLQKEKERKRYCR